MTTKIKVDIINYCFPNVHVFHLSFELNCIQKIEIALKNS